MEERWDIFELTAGETFGTKPWGLLLSLVDLVPEFGNITEGCSVFGQQTEILRLMLSYLQKYLNLALSILISQTKILPSRKWAWVS